MVTMSKTLTDQFAEQGFVKVEGVLDPESVLDPINEEYHGVLDQLASDLYEAGKISSKFEDLPFDARLIKIYQETKQAHSQYFDFSLPFQGVQDDTPFWTGPAVFNAFVNANLLDVVEQLIGPEIYSNPVQHVRIKPPEKLLPKNDFHFQKKKQYFHPDPLQKFAFDIIYLLRQFQNFFHKQNDEGRYLYLPWCLCCFQHEELILLLILEYTKQHKHH